MLKEAKVQSKIIKEDLTYLIDIIKPKLIAQLIIDYRDNDLDSVPEFMEYKNLRYLMDLKNKENKINLIVQFQKVDELKSFETGKMLSVLIADSRGNRVKLLLWDNQPAVLEQQNISTGDVVFITGANTRLDKDGKKILNLGKFGEMRKIVDLIKIQRFDPKEKKAPLLKIAEINNSTLLASIQGKITFISPIINIEKIGKKIELSKIVVKDNTGSFEVVFWRNNAKRSLKLRIGDEVRLTNIKMKYNEYSKTMGGSFTKSSVVSSVETNLNLAKLPPKYNKKDTSLRGKVSSVPKIKHLVSTSPVETIFSFTMKDKENNDYMVTVIKPDFDKLLEFITIGNEIVLNKINLRSSANLIYKYEVYVTNKSGIRLILE